MTLRVEWLVVGVLVVGLIGCDGARILAIFPSPSRSHIISFEALTKELAFRGHHMTVLSSFPQKQPIDNYTDIVVPRNLFGLEKIKVFEIAGLNIITEFVVQMALFSKLSEDLCEFFLEHPDVQKLIQAKDDEYDLLILEVFFGECFMGFAHKFKVPVIGIISTGGTHWMLDYVGNPSPYAYTPSAFLNYGHSMTFLQRLHNSVSVTLSNLFRSLVILPGQDVIMKKYFNASGPHPYLADITRNTSLLLLNSHVSIGYPRPYLPNVIEVGGMHIKPGQKLPQDLKKFLDESEDGVVYFSMGSNLNGSVLPESKRKAFLEAFSKIKQRVLWKWDGETIPGKPDNVRIATWLPQSAILEHPNVKLFITHGGLLGLQETIYYGVPIIGIPIYGDQKRNMNYAKQSGFGLILEYSNITYQSLHWALDSVLYQPSFRKNAKQISARFRDQPKTPLETAVYWTEYVLRHNGVPHLRSTTLDLTWYQYFLIDVIAVLALGLGVVALVVYLAVKTLVALVWRPKEKFASKTRLQKDQKRKKQS